ncbi:Cytochrome c oxidase-assembly factor COX23,mitochondrial [Wickerhamomyces ciferrii]|uniref:Cytochrome c oxidase-assembly factor COX23, mitochondrial n=1 Tax=Wickerhamomyces ciferrii (strain ATCC 14091 / BCRC 22168 / CBS 111 / JCM 3599 / NBRC 0793 / NRRL Y-1031 F-60-10) TaxID=1206466 RepID=K0K802_WICCF|nr:Cytochrome c oxidase-assembly factor COX23,mitochondrial [Wickerhamomyces ciferrii]CCH40945.1 Cytochrome c oxidase-assembly factor COX23,mitochondrial [Wickerhamomyces ciferrii]
MSEVPKDSSKTDSKTDSKTTPKVDPNIQQEVDKVNFTQGSINEYKFYPDNPTSEYNIQNFANKGPSKFYDPCSQTSAMSIKCLEQNNFDRSMCTEYFKAYRECKKEWMARRRGDKMTDRAW